MENENILDKAIAKANRLVDILKEAQQKIDSKYKNPEYM